MRAALNLAGRQVLLGALAAVLAACGGGDGPSCGEGTVLQDGKCVVAAAIDACGAGTVQADGVCVLEPDAAADAVADAEGDDAGTDATTPACAPACAKGFACNADGLCEPLPRAPGWTCAPAAWADGSSCDCGCGAFDPDCADSTLPVLGCPGAQACGDDGNCPPCAANCIGKACGSDGCGGTCGACVDPAQPVCVAGACVACAPDCNGATCGDDGCGGSCGACAVGTLCASGNCVQPPPDLSCVGLCGGTAPGGCSCLAGCAAQGDCCADVGVCGCIPGCTGKACGDDGCGGSCGTCALGATCEAGACVIGQCTPETCNGHGACSLQGCACDAAFAGPFCEKCAVGYVNFPACVTACSDAGACNDGEPCTFDDCQAALGCVHLPVAVTCSDGDPCSQGDACVGGVCLALGPPGCDDGDPCTADACAAGVGCSHLPAGATACDDGDACTSGDTCASGACQGGGATDCDDGNACSDDACSPTQGCSHQGNGKTCVDGNPCTTGAVCVGLSCTAIATKPCDDGKACTVDACDAGTGACSHQPAPAATGCDDDDLCTSGDACDGAGACVGGAKICALGVTQGLLARYSAAQPSTLAAGSDLGVGAWQDQSGKGHTLTAIDAAKAPKIVQKGVHGRRGVRLDGAAGLQTAAFDVGSALSVAAVVCAGVGPDLGTIASQGGWQLEGAGGTLSLGVGGAVVSAPGVQAGGCQVVVGRVGPGGVELSRTATETTLHAGSGALAAGKQALQIGPDGGTAVLGELLLYDHALSDDERVAVVTYLRMAWGFAPPKPDVAWYDAADLATVVTATDKSGAVAQWRDKSGQDRHAVPAGGTAPVWYAVGTSNGEPAIRFDGAQVRLQTAAVPTSPALTALVVFELDAPQPLGTVITHGQDQAFALRQEPGAAPSFAWQIAKDAAVAKLGYQAGAWQLVTAVQDGTATLLYADPQAAQTATQAAAIAPAAVALTLGNGAAGDRSMGGFVAEVQLFAKALGAIDRAFVEAGLRVKYGL